MYDEGWVQGLGTGLWFDEFCDRLWTYVRIRENICDRIEVDDRPTLHFVVEFLRLLILLPSDLFQSRLGVVPQRFGVLGGLGGVLVLSVDETALRLQQLLLFLSHGFLCFHLLL